MPVSLSLNKDGEILHEKSIQDLREDESHSTKCSTVTWASVLGSQDPRSPHQILVVGVVTGVLNTTANLARREARTKSGSFWAFGWFIE
jgi:hypothetical protein